MEIISRSPVIMLDGGHNPECAAALENVLVRFAGDKSITVLIGMMADKDTKDYLAAILPHCKPRCLQSRQIRAPRMKPSSFVRESAFVGTLFP